MKKLVLVVAQETALRARIARTLYPAGYSVELAAGEKRALELIADKQINAAIVVSASDATSLAFARQLADNVPRLIVLAERPEDVARLNTSLPDVTVYKAQPIDEQQLLDGLAHVTESPADGEFRPDPDALRLAGCRIDFAGRSFIHADGRQVALTRAEASLLTALARSPGTVLSRDQLSYAVGGHGAELYGRGIDVLIGMLRRKVEPDPKLPRFILTVSGGGYKFATGQQTADDHSLTSLRPRGPFQIEPAGPVSGTPAALAIGLPHLPPERRQITALSCELIISTAASDADPENFARIGQSFQEACARIISSANGHISGTSWHEVSALFGYPKAHEDDAERAVHAALELVAKVGELLAPAGDPINIRIGIATGFVVVDDHGAVGQPSTIAARLRNIAPANSILVAANTQSLLGNAFISGELGAYEFPGLPEKVTACLITGKKAVENRFSSKRGPRLTQFVGRAHELQQLMAAWKNVKAGKGQVVLLSGEAGIGKSRVCEVVLQHVSADPHMTIRYQCAPQHANSPFHSIIEQLERAAQFDPGDTPDVKLEKLTTILFEPGGIAPADARSCTALLSIPTKESLPVDQTAQRKKDLAISALVRLILGFARRTPVVVELSDAHWADSSTLELFSQLIASVRSAPVLILMNFRPDFFPPWLDEPHVAMLRLDRLGREQTEAIVFDVAGGKSLPPATLAQIISKTDGVPLFVEELTKSVLESDTLEGTDDRRVSGNSLPPLAIPATLLDSLTARLDRLGPVKKIAQIGAVIGREFSYQLLAAVAPLSAPLLQAALAQLAAPELIFVRGEPPNSTYVFKHALVQDAAYGTLLRSERQQLHGRIADAIEDGFADIVESQPELLAHHLMRAGLSARAIGYLRKAGQRAIERSANSEARLHLTQALELLQSHPEDAARAHQALELEVMLGQALIASRGYAAPETREVLLRAKSLIDDSTDPAQRLAILYGIWAGYYVGGEVARQTEAAIEFMAVAEQYEDTGARSVAHRILGTTYLTKGDFGAALPHLMQAETLYDPQQHGLLRSRYGQDVGAAALCYRSWALWHLGLVEQAAETADTAVRRSDELSHPHTSAFTICHARGLFDIFRRSPGEMRTYAGSIVSFCHEHGLSHWMACGRILEGWASISEGEYDHGITLLQSGTAAWQKAGARLWLPLFLALEAEAHAKQGDIASAQAAIEKAIDVAEKGGEQWCLAELLRIKASLLGTTNHTGDQVETLYLASLQIARRQQARCWELRTACDLASHWRRNDRTTEALRLLQPIYDQFTEGLQTADLRAARQIIDRLRADEAQNAGNI